MISENIEYHVNRRKQDIINLLHFCDKTDENMITFYENIQCDAMICDGYLSVLFCFLCTFVTFQISFTEFTAMAEELDGEEFVVDKILDKRVRNGKIEYYLSWKVKDQRFM